jgi:aryl-alcohol dehydrogenase-like predicted oxidoreductase
MNLGIGTAQFGSNYGVANTLGKVSVKDITAILDHAESAGLNIIDTAIDYGESEQALGCAGVQNWNIVTKLPSIPKPCGNKVEWVIENVSNSLKRLNVNSIYGLLLHRPLELLEESNYCVWETLTDLRRNGLIKKIGYSIYSPNELFDLWDEFLPDIVQGPFNIVDRRIEQYGALDQMERKGIEFHARSVFLQGLLLLSDNERHSKFDRWSAFWKLWDVWLQKNSLTPLEACISFVSQHPKVSKTIIGVDCLDHLVQIIKCADIKICDIPLELSSSDLNLINPYNWQFL